MRNASSLLLLTFIFLYLLLFPAQTAAAVARGLTLWYEQVVPTLLPLCILSYIIIQTNLYHSVFQRLSGALPYNRRGAAERFYPICLGFTCGFPIGSKVTADLYDLGLLSPDQTTRLCAVSNQFGPAFVVNYIAVSQLQQPGDWRILLPGIYLPPLLLGAIWALSARNKSSESCQPQKDKKKPAPSSRLNVRILDTGIINGFETMLRIAGYIVIFSIVSGIIAQIPLQIPIIKALISGVCEVTTGVREISAVFSGHTAKLTVICAVVSSGGICGLFQTQAMMRHTSFRLSHYIIFKTLCAAFSAVLCAVMRQII